VRVRGKYFDVVVYRGGYEIVSKNAKHPKDSEPLPKFEFGGIRRLFFEITDRCNYRCIHCYNGDSRQETTFIDPDTMKNALEKINSAYSIETIQITGGEPTLHPQLQRIIGTSKKFADYVEIFTNGFLLNEVAPILLTENVRVIVSMYSLNPQKYAYMTRVPAVDRVIENILDFYEKGGKISVRIPVIPGINDEDARDVIMFFRAKGIRASSSIIIPYGRSRDWKASKLRKKRLPSRRNWIFAPIAAAGYSECWATHLAVSWNLDVSPCIFAREYKLGNLAADDIEIIKRNHKAISRAFAPDLLSDCENCALRYVCKRCPPRAKAYGVLGKREAHCPFALSLDITQ